MERLHPRLHSLMRQQGWTRLTNAQEAAWPAIASKQHVLLVAPTGHGKTEAALLPVLSRLLSAREQAKAWPTGFKALYITPLRALNRDLLGRLESWAEALELTIGVRHGDTTPAERARQSRNPPELLITTPETVQLLLYGDRLRQHLRSVRFVIVDELHALADSERGAQLAVALERIEEVIAQPAALAKQKAKDRVGPKEAAASSRGGFQRIGLSATVADAELLADFLSGGRPRRIATVDEHKDIQLRVVVATATQEDARDAADLQVSPTVMAQLRVLRNIIEDHERVLIFTNSRDAAETLASRGALLDEREGRQPVLGLHHGSLSPEHRAQTEDAFKQGDLKALVATSSMELGIDVGAIDHVVQVGSPHNVARLVQRLGRAGHRVGATAHGTLLAHGAEDALECVTVAEAAVAGRLEPIHIRQAPLVVLANQLVALSNEYADVDAGWAQAVICRAYPFHDLDPGLFEAAWQALLDLKTLFAAQGTGGLGRSGRGRRHFLDHISLIPDDKKYRVLDEAAKRTIGTVDDAFVAAGLGPGTAFVMAGRTWNVLAVEPDEARVRVAPARDVAANVQWSGQRLPVSFHLARDVARYRGRLAAGERAPTVDAKAALEVAAGPILEQVAAGLEVPTDRVVAIERGRDVTVHVPLGSKGNEALGRLTQALLHQRSGAAVGMESDAYRIRFTLPPDTTPADIDDAWESLDPDSLDLVLAALLADAPVAKQHLVHVARHFGAVPKQFDPNRLGRKLFESLRSHLALQEESFDRLVHDRFDLEAVAWLLRGLRDGSIRVVHQGVGPLAALGHEEAVRLLRPAPANEALLARVRARIEASDVWMVCTECRHHWDAQAGDLPRRIRCRRCGTIDVACLRPWHQDLLPLLAKGRTWTPDERRERDRIIRNGRLVGSFGRPACLALVGRGVGPTAAARVLQKSEDPESLAFWRAVLDEELQFARTSAYW